MKNFAKIGSFHTSDASKESVHNRLSKMMNVALSIDDVFPISEDAFCVAHPSGFNTVFSVVECEDRGKKEYKINISSSEYALPAQYYKIAFNIFSESIINDNDSFNLEGIVVTDKELSKSSVPMPHVFEHLSNATFRIINSAENNVSVIQTSYKKKDNEWALNFMSDALNNSNDFYLTDVNHAKIVSANIREEKLKSREL